ncbi:hypothetical protein B0H14DRAFT_2654265 [Mycena olivaceomarginata]|nr:hypothetical protein B0H14DRAFT_2654265 [Mycena olivaceomarginata]
MWCKLQSMIFLSFLAHPANQHQGGTSFHPFFDLNVYFPSQEFAALIPVVGTWPAVKRTKYHGGNLQNAPVTPVFLFDGRVTQGETGKKVSQEPLAFTEPLKRIKSFGFYLYEGRHRARQMPTSVAELSTKIASICVAQGLAPSVKHIRSYLEQLDAHDSLRPR